MKAEHSGASLSTQVRWAIGVSQTVADRELGILGSGLSMLQRIGPRATAHKGTPSVSVESVTNYVRHYHVIVRYLT